VRCTPAALHVGGFDLPPPRFLPDRPIVRIAVTERGLEELARFLHHAYARDAAGRPVRIRPGDDPRSWFYTATGRYHALAHNSNHWAVEALRAAGAPSTPPRRRRRVRSSRSSAVRDLGGRRRVPA
jgi:hypothetical protein